MLFQTCMKFYLRLSSKEDILKNVGNQTVSGSHWLPLYFFLYYWSQWLPSTVQLHTFFKMYSFVFNRRKKLRTILLSGWDVSHSLYPPLSRTMCFCVAPPGGDHRWRLHGGVGPSCEERETARTRDRPHVSGSAGGRSLLSNAPPTRPAAPPTHRHPQRWGSRVMKVFNRVQVQHRAVWPLWGHICLLMAD